MTIEEQIEDIKAQVEAGFKAQHEEQELIKNIVSEPAVTRDPVDTLFDRMLDNLFFGI